MEWLSGYATQIRESYGVDPRVYLALVVITVPPFYFALAVVIKRLVRAWRRDSRHAFDAAAHDPVLIGALLLTVLVWLIPYVYVAVVGRTLPWWIVFLLLALLCLGAVSLVQRLRSGLRRAKESEGVDT